MSVSPRKALRLVGGNETKKPEFEATSLELAAINRFLNFALADIKHQFEELNRQPSVSRSTMEGAQTTAVMLSNYVSALRGGVDEMRLKQPMVENP